MVRLVDFLINCRIEAKYQHPMGKKRPYHINWNVEEAAAAAV